MMPLSIFTVLILSTSSASYDDGKLVTIPSSCNAINANGLFYIKPMPDKGVLPVICNNGWNMIDGSLDTDLNFLPSFLNSWDYGKTTVRSFSRLDDTSTFREWWLPANDNTKFRIAPSCDQCIQGEFGDNTVYYTDSYSYCASDLKESGCIDDITSDDYYPESCNQCDVTVEVDDDGKWIACSSVQMDSEHHINHDHSECVSHGFTVRPSISHLRDACTCYKQDELDNYGIFVSYQVPISELPQVSWTVTDPSDLSEIYETYNLDPDTFRIDQYMKFTVLTDEINDFREHNIVELYQTDFQHGTYRILESGTYKIMEDIVFNFQAPDPEEMDDLDSFSPNAIDGDRLYWYPIWDEGLGDSEYPGLYRYQGAYALGFFAGISIETDYVKIDLNGHTLSQDRSFYFQQRFFSLIELSSQPFNPGQGPANWGPMMTNGNHIDIINGNLGLSSHHGVHGNSNNYVKIKNVNTFNFDVAGFQCNGCNHVVISDCIVGPQNQDIPVLGRYTHARAFIPRLKQLSLSNGDHYVTFHGRQPVKVDTLIDRLINQMDMMYFHFINGVEYDEEDEEWIAAKKLFYNPSGWMDGGTSYGIVLGGTGAQVVGIGARIEDTSNITLQNIEIFGIGNKLIEKIKYAAENGATRLMFFDSVDWVAVSDQVDDPTTSVYLGDAYTDCIFAVDKYMDSWYYLNSLYITSDEEGYVFDGDSSGFGDAVFTRNGAPLSGCGTDIQLHSSKGAVGLRVDGVQNINIDKIYIHDVANWADLGNQDWCGPYEHVSVGDEDGDIQYGFSGTRSHGMFIDHATGSLSNIQIEGIESYNGEANGLSIYKGCDLLLENIQVDNIYAGTQLTDDDIQTLDLPNLIPRACGVDIHDDTIVIIDEDNGIINGDDITGFETCYDELGEDETDDEEGFAFNMLRLGEMENKWNNRHYLIMLISLILLIVFIYFKATMKRCNQYKKNEENKLSEITPLL